MKYLLTTLAFLALSLSSQEVLASALAQKPAGDQAALQAQFGEMNMSASEFAALTPKEIAKKTGRKMSWGEKILFKITQKRIKKQLAKGIQPPLAEGGAGASNSNGIASIILGVVAWSLCLLLLLNPESVFLMILFILGLACGLVGFGAGLKGLEEDESRAPAIIGIVLNAPMGGICLVAIIAIVIWLERLNDDD